MDHTPGGADHDGLSDQAPRERAPVEEARRSRPAEAPTRPSAPTSATPRRRPRDRPAGGRRGAPGRCPPPPPRSHRPHSPIGRPQHPIGRRRSTRHPPERLQRHPIHPQGPRRRMWLSSRVAALESPCSAEISSRSVKTPPVEAPGSRRAPGGSAPGARCDSACSRAARSHRADPAERAAPAGRADPGGTPGRASDRGPAPGCGTRGSRWGTHRGTRGRWTADPAPRGGPRRLERARCLRATPGPTRGSSSARCGSSLSLLSSARYPPMPWRELISPQLRASLWIRLQQRVGCPSSRRSRSGQAGRQAGAGACPGSSHAGREHAEIRPRGRRDRSGHARLSLLPATGGVARLTPCVRLGRPVRRGSLVAGGTRRGAPAVHTRDRVTRWAAQRAVPPRGRSCLGGSPWRHPRRWGGCAPCAPGDSPCSP